MNAGYYFTTDLFPITKGEDEETNPGCYGQKLGEWLCDKLSRLGYNTSLVPEDWGWCVMCADKDYMLWIGCGVELDDEFYENYDPEIPPRGSDVVWYVFTHIEVPFFYLKSIIKKIVGKLDLKVPLEKLDADLKTVLETESRINLQANT